MYLGEHVGALEQVWDSVAADYQRRQSSGMEAAVDPEGLWERALADPVEYADYVVAFHGDPVWTSARDSHLTALVEIHTTGQPPAAIFQGRLPDAVPTPGSTR